MSFTLVLCGAARAQSAPAAPPLTLWNAVAVSWAAEAESVSVLERSDDLKLWAAEGSAVFGKGGDVLRYVASGTAPSGFLRVRKELQPQTGKSPWKLDSSRMVFNTAAGVRALTFSGSQAGTLTMPDREPEEVTWEWQRTDAASGKLVIFRSEGISETLEMRFEGAGAGTFSATIKENGEVSAYTSGTFREDASENLQASRPVSLTDKLITFSGIGRPLALTVKADLTATLPAPAEDKEGTVTYSGSTPAAAVVDLTLDDGSTETWALSFTGPDCGNYSGTTTKGGVLRRTSRGTFTIAPR